MPVSLGAKPEHDFNDPLGLLSDCHRRIEKFLGILLRVVESRQGGDLDREHREALEAALRYFQVALPRHTQDEEESLFPRLRASGKASACAAMESLAALEADHAAADVGHQRVDALARQWLKEGTLPAEKVSELRTILEQLRDTYTRHIRVEDTQLFPAAGQVLDAEQVRQIGQEMARRRDVSR